MEIREALTFDDVLLVPGASNGAAVDGGYRDLRDPRDPLNIPLCQLGDGHGDRGAHGDCHGAGGRHGGDPPQSGYRGAGAARCAG